jgi:hypothetical protein
VSAEALVNTKAAHATPDAQDPLFANLESGASSALLPALPLGLEFRFGERVSHKGEPPESGCDPLPNTEPRRVAGAEPVGAEATYV